MTNGIEFLFKKNGVEYIKGAASLEDEHTISTKLLAGGDRTIEAANIILATGSSTFLLPFSLLTHRQPPHPHSPCG